MNSFIYLKCPKGIWEEEGESWEGRATDMEGQGTTPNNVMLHHNSRMAG